MSIFNWIRAVAAAELSPGCKAFCLELIPHLNSKTLETHLSVSRIADKVTAALPSVRVYRRQLRAAGLLRSGEGWRLIYPQGGISTDPGGISTDPGGDPHRSQRGISTDPKRGSPQIPPSYKGTSTFFSTSLSTNNSCWDITSLRPNRRPEINGRAQRSDVDVNSWLREWHQNKGQDFPWSRWAQCVLPYLSAEEGGELLDALLSTPDPNLRYAIAIVSRMCKGSSKPRRSTQPNNACRVPVVVPGRSEDDDAWLEAISR